MPRTSAKRAVQAAYMRRRKASRVAARLCQACPKRAVSVLFCRKHLAIERARKQESRRRQKPKSPLNHCAVCGALGHNAGSHR